MDKSDLEEAYREYQKYEHVEGAYECMKFLWSEWGDYGAVTDFREWIDTLPVNEKNLEMAKQSYFMTGKDKFDDFILAMEWDRTNKFYLPRRKQLKPIVDEMQKLADHDLKVLGVAAPPGVGKTALGNFFMAFTAGRIPDKGMLMGSHSESILKENYAESLRMIGSDEYHFFDIFPERTLVRTNAQDLKIDLDTPKRFATYQFGSMGSSLAGKIRAQSLMYIDDLIPNIETAMNRERLEKTWRNFTTDYMQRIEGNCVILLIMTRWSVHDPMGRLEREYEGDPTAKFISLSALDENGESNFDYGGDIGFSTERYEQIRATMDDVSWRALYMNQPIEREGLLYDADELSYYYDLPGEAPDAVISVVDTKDKGTDDCVMPVAYQYGDKYYIEDFICDDATPDITVPKIASKLMEHGVKLCRFESNAAGGRIANEVDELVKKKGGTCSITTKYSTQNKETRIIVGSMWVKAHCLFKAKEQRSKEYDKAMRLLCGFSHVSKTKKDDVPDAMAMLSDFAQSFEANTVTVHRRWF